VDLLLVVQDVLRTGWLKLSQENALRDAVRKRPKFSAAELRALVDLQKALQSGHVAVGIRKQCVNVMEKLVQDAIVEEITAGGLEEEDLPDLGDVAGYALNRLPPLYATTREGFEYQFGQAKKKSWGTIKERIREAIGRSRARPDPRPGSEPLGRNSGADTVFQIVNRLSQGANEGE
jgi:hypothetical protein